MSSSTSLSVSSVNGSASRSPLSEPSEDPPGIAGPFLPPNGAPSPGADENPLPDGVSLLEAGSQRGRNTP